MKSPFPNAHTIDATRFTIYLPDRNRFGEFIVDIELWVREAALVLTSITGGATRLAPATGMWYNTQDNLVIEETTHLIYTFFDPNEFLKRIDEVRDFISRFALETKQQSVAVELAGKVHFISEFRMPPKLTVVA